MSKHQADLLKDEVDGEELCKQLQDREHAHPLSQQYIVLKLSQREEDRAI